MKLIHWLVIFTMDTRVTFSPDLFVHVAFEYCLTRFICTRCIWILSHQIYFCTHCIWILSHQIYLYTVHLNIISPDLFVHSAFEYYLTRFICTQCIWILSHQIYLYKLHLNIVSCAVVSCIMSIWICHRFEFLVPLTRTWVEEKSTFNLLISKQVFMQDQMFACPTATTCPVALGWFTNIHVYINRHTKNKHVKYT